MNTTLWLLKHGLIYWWMTLLQPSLVMRFLFTPWGEQRGLECAKLTCGLRVHHKTINENKTIRCKTNENLWGFFKSKKIFIAASRFLNAPYTVSCKHSSNLVVCYICLMFLDHIWFNKGNIVGYVLLCVSSNYSGSSYVVFFTKFCYFFK